MTPQQMAYYKMQQQRQNTLRAYVLAKQAEEKKRQELQRAQTTEPEIQETAEPIEEQQLDPVEEPAVQEPEQPAEEPTVENPVQEPIDGPNGRTRR